MEQPLVSIIIPVYNAAPFLPKCIQSICDQRYQNLEIILVNDGSKDVSLDICKMYVGVDHRIIVVDKDNSGVSSTRNLAIRLAKGKYLQFVDSDDWIDENATRLLVERAEETNSDLVISHYCRVSANGRKTVHGFLDQKAVMDKKAFALHLMDEPASFYYGVMWNKLYRSDIIKQYQIYCNEALTWSEDLQFNLEYIRYAERFCSLQTPIYYYVKNKKSITSTSITIANTVTVKKSLFAYYKDLYVSMGLYEKYKVQIHKYLIADARKG